jgi:hypothetical protein
MQLLFGPQLPHPTTGYVRTPKHATADAIDEDARMTPARTHGTAHVIAAAGIEAAEQNARAASPGLWADGAMCRRVLGEAGIRLGR